MRGDWDARGEAHVVARFDYGVGLGVEPDVAVDAVTRAQLLARHRHLTIREVPEEDRLGARPDEDLAIAHAVRLHLVHVVEQQNL